MKKKIFIILALVVVISVICCTVAVAEELPTEPSGTFTDETVDETPDKTGEPSVTDKIQEAGDEALSWFTAVAYALAGTGGVGLISAVIALAVKGVKLFKAIQSANLNNEQLKNAYNALVDEFGSLKQSVDILNNDTSTNLAVLLDKSKTADDKNAALCRTLATLINYSNLPDESKNNVLGEMNAALGYAKSEVSTNEEND